MDDRGTGVHIRLLAAPGAEGKKSHDEARLLWTELLARLTHVADVFARPDIAADLRSRGVRRTDAVMASLAREYAKAGQIALTLGTAPRPHEVMHRARDLDGHGDLQQELLALAGGYRLLIQALALPSDCHRQRWLEGRALVHTAQAQALQAPR